MHACVCIYIYIINIQINIRKQNNKHIQFSDASYQSQEITVKIFSMLLLELLEGLVVQIQTQVSRQIQLLKFRR